MIMSSVARVKFIKTKSFLVIIPKCLKYSDHEIKSYSCSNSKNEKVGKIFWITNQGKRDYKYGQL